MSDRPIHSLAHAKLNLSLRVLARELSGFHQIETIFCALDLADDIAITRIAEGISLEVVPAAGQAGAAPDLGPIEQNLACRAAALFLRAATLSHGVHIRLTKRIPAGAGLGGGSSDAAAVLRALNASQNEPLPPDELLRIGARIGSDVPFFLTDAVLALAWGRGERMMTLPPLPPASVVLAVPPERISTAVAYAALSAARAPSPATHEIRAWQDIALTARNDFEDIIFAQHPRLAGMRQMLEDAGAMMARMTGTGSVVFGVFTDTAAADAAASRVSDAFADIETIVTRTRTVD